MVCDLRNDDCEPVDYVISWATFEHILDYGAVLQTMAKRLKPCGRLLTAFEPLWPSPFGHHGRVNRNLPLKLGGTSLVSSTLPGTIPYSQDQSEP